MQLATNRLKNFIEVERTFGDLESKFIVNGQSCWQLYILRDYY